MINYDGQINLNPNIRLIYMVFDLDKRYVLCYTGNISCAHAVADGILNSDIKSISYAKIKSALDEHKRFIIFNNVRLIKKNILEDFDPLKGEKIIFSY